MNPHENRLAGRQALHIGDEAAARNAVKNVAYTIVNGNAYNNVKPGATAYYDESPWHRTLTIINWVLIALCALGVVWMVLRQIDDKKNPQKYAH